jgi:hypothetical protein
VKYFWQGNLAANVVGTNATDFTTRGTAAPNGYAPEYGSPAVQRLYMNFKTNSSGIPFRNVVTWNAIDADANRANVDILSCFTKNDATVTDLTLVARGVGATATAATEGYMARCELAGNIYISRRASATAIATIATTAFTFTAGKSYFVRFRVNGTAPATLQLKLWDAELGSAGEPTAWTLTTTDATFTSAGWVGFGGFDAGTGNTVAPWNFLAVGTNGDTAECPITNAEFYDWANKPNQRCIIAELEATGYNAGVSPYTKTVKLYVSNIGYTSKQQDTPSLKHYDNYIASVPTFSRNMGEALTGPSQVGFGELVLKNPAVTAGGPGRLDDLLRARINRSYCRMLVGSPDWARHNFRPIITGRAGLPSAPSPDLIKIPLADLADFFNVPLSATKFTADEFLDRTKPKMYGIPRCVELQVDGTTKIATLHDAAMVDMNDNTYRIFDATSNGFTHIGGTKSATLAISSVDATTDTITLSAVHNLQAGYRVRFGGGTVPTGLSTGVNYWVLAAGLTTTAFKVTATKGSTTPVDLTSTTGNAKVNSFGYTFDAAGGTVEFVNLPAGRAFIFEPASSQGGTATATIRDIAFTTAGLSLNFKDSAAFTAALATDTSSGGFAAAIGAGVTCRDALDDVAKRCRVWYGFSTDGLLQTGAIALPGATAVRSFTSSDVKMNGVSLTKIDRPIDFSKSLIYSRPWYPLGPLPQVPGVKYTGGDDYGQTSAELFAGKTAAAATSYGAAGIPIDDHPDQTDSTTTAVFDTYGGDVNALVAFYKYPMGFFEVKTKFGALWTTSRPLSLGDTISLDYPRLGWKNYTGADDLSPDNTGDYDARLAVVSGISVNLAAPPDEQVTLRLYRPVRGYYPAADFN